MPKLNFLAQLTSRVGLKSTSSASSSSSSVSSAGASDGSDSTSSGTAAAPAAAALAAPSSRGPMSLFAEIARFRKPEADETAVTATGTDSGEMNKENGPRMNIGTNILQIYVEVGIHFIIASLFLVLRFIF